MEGKARSAVDDYLVRHRSSLTDGRYATPGGFDERDRHRIRTDGTAPAGCRKLWTRIRLRNVLGDDRGAACRGQPRKCSRCARTFRCGGIGPDQGTQALWRPSAIRRRKRTCQCTGHAEEERGNDPAALGLVSRIARIAACGSKSLEMAKACRTLHTRIFQTGDFELRDVLGPRPRMYASVDDRTGLARAAQGAALASWHAASFARRPPRSGTNPRASKASRWRPNMPPHWRPEPNSTGWRDILRGSRRRRAASNLFLEQQFPRGAREAACAPQNIARCRRFAMPGSRGDLP